MNKSGKSGIFVDSPIYLESEDKLGFDRIASFLADCISQPPNHTSVTLGLDGIWGSGKSSVLHLLKDKIESRTAAHAEHEIGTVVVNFSPWLITNRTALIISFFSQLNNALDVASARVPRDRLFRERAVAKVLKQAKTKINQFSGVVAIASAALSVLDPVTATMIGGGAKVTKLLTNESAESDNIERLKSEVFALLRDITDKDPSFRLLVLIDDLDRLEPAESLEVIRLVKAVADFPATMYLLAYDRTVLAHAIANSAGVEDGEAYLEKIVQFSFKVPPLEPFQLRRWFQQEITDLYPDDVDFASERAMVVFDRWAGRLLKTPRDVRRITFAIQLLWPSLADKCDLLDLIWLQMIKEKASDPNRDLYSWLTRYLQSLDALAIGGTVIGMHEDQTELEKILGSLGWSTTKKGDKSFNFDYHNLDKMLAGVTEGFLNETGQDNSLWIHQIEDEEFQRLSTDKRLSSPWHWRLYYALDTPSHALTDDEWNALLDASGKSATELISNTRKLVEMSGEKRVDIGDQLMERAIFAQRNDELPNSEFWLQAAIELAPEIERLSKPDNMFGFSRNFEYSFARLAREGLKRLTGTKRKAVIKTLFEDSEVSGLTARLIRSQLKSEKSEENRLYLTEKELKDVSATLSKKYGQMGPPELHAVHHPIDLLFAWRDIDGDEKGVSKLLNKSADEDSDLIRTLEVLRGVKSSTYKGVPHVVESYLNVFIDAANWKLRIEGIAGANSELSNRASDLLKVWDDKKDD